MKKWIFVSLSFLGLQFANAFESHTGFCRYGESCGGIVSRDIYEAQWICSREPFDTLAKAVYQQQYDGSVRFVGYVCVSPQSGR